MSVSDSRYATAVASAKLLGESGMIDLTEDEFAFVISKKPWHAKDRNHARRCLEAVVYGSLDMLGMPRFPAPAEFISAAIAYYVHPVNVQVACSFMDGAEFSENIVNGVEKRVTAQELFAHTIRLRTGLIANLKGAEDAYYSLVESEPTLSGQLKEG